MITLMFSIYDTKTGIYGTPFFMQHAGQAIRAVQDLCDDMSTIVARHPADFALVQLGYFDDNNSGFEPKYENLGPCVSMMRQRAMPAPLFEKES